jgi:hypothetical protein
MEYLERPDVREKLESHLRTPYDPNVRLLAATVAAIRVSGVLEGWLDRFHPENYPDFCCCMAYAAHSHINSRGDIIWLLDGVFQAIKDLETIWEITFRCETMLRVGGGGFQSQVTDYKLRHALGWKTSSLTLLGFGWRFRVRDPLVCIAAAHMVVEYVKPRANWSCLIDVDLVEEEPMYRHPVRSWIKRLARPNSLYSFLCFRSRR